MIVHRFLLWLTLMASIQAVIAQSQPTEPLSKQPGKLPAKNHYVPFTFDLTFGVSKVREIKNTFGFSIAYIHNFARKNHPSPYYIGPYLTIGANKSENMGSKLIAATFGAKQMYFFSSQAKGMPFIGLDAGWRTSRIEGIPDNSISNLLPVIIPLPIYNNQQPGQPPSYQEPDPWGTSSNFTIGLSAGYYIPKHEIIGILLKFSIDIGRNVQLPFNTTTVSLSAGFIL
jgi:hypothetical protein